ncbi:hypothetical protein AB4072_12790 [Microvirga sp. 2MCAF38]|uniref:hypothetical protein n=1 Tax=Microvirga sp. 2MCAF38 TaxID=3232989 RepID=UPI003F9D75CC
MFDGSQSGRHVKDKVELLRAAILARKQVLATCKNLPREFCAHILGRKGNDWNVFTWQFAGDSERGLPLGGAWRCFRVRDLENLSLRDGEWYRGWEKWHEGQTCVDDIDQMVDAEYGPEIR